MVVLARQRRGGGQRGGGDEEACGVLQNAVEAGHGECIGTPARLTSTGLASRCWTSGRGRYAGSGSSSSPCSAASRTALQLLALALELGWRVAVHVGRRAHLVGVPQRAGLVDALEPRDAVEVLGNQFDDVLDPALALGGAPWRSSTRAPPSSARWTGQRSVTRST